MLIMPLILAVLGDILIALVSCLINNILYYYLEFQWECALCDTVLCSRLICKMQARLAFGWRFLYGALAFSMLQQKNPNIKELNT